MSLIDDESASRVGTVAATAAGEVNRRDWQRWAAAVGDHNPLWFDPEYARAQGYRDIICPPLYLQYAVLGSPPSTGCGQTVRRERYPAASRFRAPPSDGRR